MLHLIIANDELFRNGIYEKLYQAVDKVTCR